MVMVTDQVLGLREGGIHRVGLVGDAGLYELTRSRRRNFRGILRAHMIILDPHNTAIGFVLFTSSGATCQGSPVPESREDGSNRAILNPWILTANAERPRRFGFSVAAP